MVANLAVVPLPSRLPDQSIFAEPGFHFQPKSLSIDHGVNFDRWWHVVKQLSRMGESVQFWIGDAIRYGEHEFGEMYSQAADDTGLDPDTLKNYVYVAENVAKSLRSDLSYSHHQVIAPLPAREQRKWLTRAKTEGLSVRELRAKIQEAKRFPAIAADTPAGDYLDPSFKSYLIDLENVLLTQIGLCPYEPFKRELGGFIRKVRYARHRSLDSDYQAVKEQLNRMACTAEEIAEEVCISEQEIKALMDLIVQREPGIYEWRPIGVNTDVARGPRAQGLFRKDAPAGDGFQMPHSYHPAVEYDED